MSSIPLYLRLVCSLDYKGFNFLFMYTREAHPGEHYGRHRSMEQKLTHPRAFKERGRVERPILVDDLVGTEHKLYGAPPCIVLS
jgi:hypothetical protein